MLPSKLVLLVVSFWLGQAAALLVGGNNVQIKAYKREALQDLVTWDQHSLFVRGERIMFFSGEFHPFRLPVPGLWLDVFQKIKALGFSGVSFYTDWALLEGNPGNVVMDGIWSLKEFFAAATEAGIYLLARPGPYINAETAAGGMPGWLLRINGTLRSTAPDYLKATDTYMATIGKAIADAQITNGGPVVMVQPENEYSSWPNVNSTDFPLEMNREVMAYAEQQLRDAGVVVPFVVNDNLVLGSFAPGTGLGEVDLYGIDAYPLRYDCSNPDVWPTYRWTTSWHTTHEEEAPTTPFTIVEFQGGSGGSWGGYLQEMCAALVGPEAERVVYKNNWSFGATIFNIYMTYGGTNWGNLGYHGGATSYDYGAAITEDRYVYREKYPELKLQANFLKVSPAYLTASPGNQGNGTYGTPSTIGVTPLFGNGTDTNFYVVRHADFTSTNNTNYKITVSTSIGNVTLPQLGGSLVLYGRDSKIHVTDYDIGGINLIYSTAEVYTWADMGHDERLLLLYGAEGEIHEAAFPTSLGSPEIVEGSGAIIKKKGSAWIVHWQVSSQREVLKFGKLEVHLLWRNDAYNYWVLQLPAEEPIGNFSSMSKQTAVVKGGYLLRSASIIGNELHLSGDVNSTSDFEVVSAPAEKLKTIFFNNERLNTSRSSTGKLVASISYSPPTVVVPNLSAQEWKYLDSLPEIQSSYDDSLWTELDHITTNNSLGLFTPTSLYSSDYGYHTGSLIYRGHFTANGNESTFFVNSTCGVAFGNTIWLNNSWVDSWVGNSSLQIYAQTVTLPELEIGSEYVITILIDHMGQDEEAPGTDAVKFPRGLLDYELAGHPQSDVKWKLTGNFGGEQYPDITRGPRNEGAMFAERQGYHQPNPPSQNWATASPVNDGLSQPGIGFFTTTFELNMPAGWDIPMSIVYNNGNVGTNVTGYNYRSQFFINGYQFGKYVNNLGPQTVYPVPEGILDYSGNNTIALTIWALDEVGAKLTGFDLIPQTPILSGYKKPSSVSQPEWSLRGGAY